MIVQPGQWALTKIMLHLVGLQSIIIIITVIMVYIVIVIMVIMMVIVMVYDGV
jgi:hypothetical protein